MSETGENIIIQLRPSWINYAGRIIIGIAILIFSIHINCAEAGFLILLICIASAVISRYKYKFIVTDNSVIMRTGLIARNTNEIQLRHIRGISVRQGALDRIVGIGTIIFLSAAEEEAAVVFFGIDDPYGVKERIRQLQSSI